MQVLTGNDRFVGESYRMGGVGSLIGISNVATPRWGQLDIAGRAGQFEAFEKKLPVFGKG